MGHKLSVFEMLFWGLEYPFKRDNEKNLQSCVRVHRKTLKFVISHGRFADHGPKTTNTSGSQDAAGKILVLSLILQVH